MIKRRYGLCMIDEIYPVAPALLIDALMLDADIVHAHGYGTFTTDVASFASLLHKKPFVITIHGIHPTSELGHNLLLLYNVLAHRLSLRMAKAIICVSQAEAHRLKVLINDHKIWRKIVVIPNGIDLQKWQDLPTRGTFRKKFNIKSSFLLTCIGRLVKAKGFQFLILAIPYILKEVKDITVVIAGPDGGYASTLIHLIRKMHLEDKVLFTGELSDYDLKALYVDSDIVIIPSLYEPFGIVALEAMACGKPVIASKVGGLAEIIKHGVNGYLVEPANSRALAEAILTLLKNPSLSESIREEGRKTVMKYSWDHIVEMLEELYYSIRV
jgi:glycosyltransferase involved in cell wall biosynthesis